MQFTESMTIGFDEIEVMFGDDEMNCAFSLYWRHHNRCAFNDKELDINKFTAKDFFGLQFTVTF